MVWSQESGVAARSTTSRLLEGFVNQHHRNVADDRVDATAFDALQSLLDHRFFSAELVAVLIAHFGLALLRKRHRFHFLFADGTGQDFEQFCVYSHAS